MPSSDETSARGPAFVLAAATVVIAWQMFAFISTHAVNILFWDLWDIYPATLFEERSWWELTRHQVGKTRQGPGFLITRLVADLSSMNTRAESFAIGATFFVALGAAIAFVRRLKGCFHYSDAILPLLVLTTVQQDTWVGSPNLSVGAAPLLFLFLLCVAWTIHHPGPRTVAVVVFDALLVNSGYGLLAGPLTPALFTLSLAGALRRGERRNAAWAGFGLAGSLAAVALFLYGWVLNFGGECPGSGAADLLMLPGFVVLMLAKFVGLDFDHVGLLATLGGTLLFFALLGVVIRHGRRLVIHSQEKNALSRVVVTLIGFSLLYGFLNAYGRICESLLISQASRYMTFMIPAFVGLYLDLRTREGFRWRGPALAVLFVAALFGSVSVWLVTDDGAARIRDSKMRWKQCYLRIEDVGQCDAEARAQVYPWDPEVNLPPKLEYLKKNRLNLYSGR